MNWSRREFSIGMGAAAAISLQPASAFAGLAGRPGMVLHEPAVEASTAFAARCARRGARVFSMEEDIGTLWHGLLRRRIADGLPLSGLTRPATSFLVATLGRDAGFQVTEMAIRPCAPLVAWRIERIKGRPSAPGA